AAIREFYNGRDKTAKEKAQGHLNANMLPSDVTPDFVAELLAKGIIGNDSRARNASPTRRAALDKMVTPFRQLKEQFDNLTPDWKAAQDTLRKATSGHRDMTGKEVFDSMADTIHN